MLRGISQAVLLGGSFDFGAILAANATNAWWAETLPASGSTGNWTDINGVAATATGDPQVGTINGKRAALFAGAQFYRTAAFSAAVVQPFAYVIVANSTPDAFRAMVDRATSTERVAILRSPAGAVYFDIRSPNQGGGDTAAPNTFVARGLVNGASSSIRINGGAPTAATAGTQVLDGVTIGALAINSNLWIGNISLTAIVAPHALIADPALRLADVVARAAAVEAGALIEYSIV